MGFDLWPICGDFDFKDFLPPGVGCRAVIIFQGSVLLRKMRMVAGFEICIGACCERFIGCVDPTCCSLALRLAGVEHDGVAVETAGARVWPVAIAAHGAKA